MQIYFDIKDAELSQKLKTLLQEFQGRSDLCFTSVDHMTSREGDEIIQLRWNKIPSHSSNARTEGKTGKGKHNVKSQAEVDIVRNQRKYLSESSLDESIDESESEIISSYEEGYCVVSEKEYEENDNTRGNPKKELKDFENDDDFDVNKYLDNLLKRVSMAFGEFKSKTRRPRDYFLSKIKQNSKSNVERWESTQDKTSLKSVQQQIDRMSRSKTSNRERKESENDDDFDINEYLDSLLKRVSVAAGDLKGQPRKSSDAPSTDFVSRHEQSPKSHMERWKSTQKDASPPPKRKFAITDRIKQRVLQQEREKTRKVKELEKTLKDCVKCLKQGFCNIMWHKQIYLEILVLDFQLAPSDEWCTCNVCEDGSYQCACVFKELIRLVKRKAIDCCCAMCEVPRQHCLREQIRLLRKSGVSDIRPYNTSPNRDEAPQFAIDTFSTLKGSTPIEWIALFINTGM